MYDFRTLSPLDFEELARDLLQAEFELRLESFGPGADSGIDFRFAGNLGKTIAAASRMLAENMGSALEQLHLLIDMYDWLKPPALTRLTRRADFFTRFAASRDSCYPLLAPASRPSGSCSAIAGGSGTTSTRLPAG